MSGARTCSDTEQGAVATIVVVMLAAGVLLGFLALSVDVGRTVLERRELQNGADAGALSLAQSCAQGNCVAGADGVVALVNNNAGDSAHTISLQCGSAGTGLPPCPAGDVSDIKQCPPVPPGFGGVSFVEVHTRTSSGGNSFIENVFGEAAGGAATSTVDSCARAGWGPPGGASVLPLTFSFCEYKSAIDDPTIGFGELPIGANPHKGETALALKYHPSKSEDPCIDLMHSGIDAPGGFGWLDETGCVAEIDRGGWVSGDPGKSPPSDCVTAGDTVLIPIYDETNDAGGSNLDYHIDGFAAFYITAIEGFPSVKDSRIGPSYPGSAADQECKDESNTNSSCLFGWFLDDYVDFTGTINPGGTDYGVTVVQPLG